MDGIGPVPYGEVMVRRVATIGLLVAVVGILLSVPWRSTGPAAPGTPLDHAGFVLLGLLPQVGTLLLTVGVVMLALAILTRTTGRLPLRDHPVSLVWIGVSLWLGAVLLGLVVSALLPATAYPAVLVGLNVALLLQAVGGTVLGLWLTGLLVDRGTAPQRPAASTAEARPPT